MIKVIMEAGSIYWSNKMNELALHEQTHLPQPLHACSEALKCSILSKGEIYKSKLLCIFIDLKIK